jgi:hypothetical protein
MRKTWRLLRDKLPTIYTYGCAAHVFNLHAKDLCGIEELETTVDEINMIVNHFNKHLQAGGLATLRSFQKEIYGKEKALKKPGKTRWNSQIDAAQSLMDSKDALTRTVNHADFNRNTDTGKQIRNLILDALEEEFWDRVALLIRVLQPLRLAIICLQSDTATMGDVYAQWICVHSAHSEISGTDFKNTGTKDKLLEILEQRMDFLIHPLHFVTYAFHPRYCKVSTMPRAVARKWLIALAQDGKLGGQPDSTLLKEKLNKELNWFFGVFLSNSMYDAAWTPDEICKPPVSARTPSASPRPPPGATAMPR